MKNKKKILVIELIICMSLLVFGCEKSNNEKIQETTRSIIETTASEVVTQESTTIEETTKLKTYTFKGEYLGEEDPYDTLEIKKKKDGTYKVTMFIERCDSIKGTATLENGILVVDGVSEYVCAENTHEMANVTLKIEPNQDNVILTCIESDHPYIKINDNFSFCKIIKPIVLDSSFCNKKQPYIWDGFRPDGTKDYYKIYHSYAVDLDSDGKKEKIEVREETVESTNGDENSKLRMATLSIDGKEIIKDYDEVGIHIEASIYKIKDEYLIRIEESAFSRYTNYCGEFYRYDDGKLELAYKDMTISFYAKVTDMVILDEHQGQFSSIGQVEWDMAYKLEGNEWEQMWEESIASYKINKDITLAKKLFLYEQPTHSSEKIEIKKGAKIDIRKIVEKEDGSYWIQIVATDKSDNHIEGYYEDGFDNLGSSNKHGIFKGTEGNFSG